MQCLLIISLVFLCFILGAIFYKAWNSQLSSRESLTRQILYQSKRVRLMMKEIEKKEKEVSIVKKKVTLLIHQYRTTKEL